MTVRLLIADDHQLFRRGLRQLCEINGGFTVVAEAETGEQAIALAREHRPDVILMDIRMAGITGVEAARQILYENPSARILMLSMYRQDPYVTNALKAGARGYLLKDCSEETLFAAIRAVHRGEAWLDSAVTAAVLSQFSQAHAAESTPQTLTETELEIMRLVARGADNEEIAGQLHLAKSTVTNHLRAIFTKLGVNNRTEAALYAIRRGWAPIDAED